MSELITYIISEADGGMTLELEEGYLPAKLVNSAPKPSNYIVYDENQYESAAPDDEIDIFDLIRDDSDPKKTAIYRMHRYSDNPEGNPTGRKKAIPKKNIIQVGKKLN